MLIFRALAIACFSFLTEPMHANASDDPNTEGLVYIQNIKADHRIYLFPNIFITYEIIGDSLFVDSDTIDYFSSYDEIFSFLNVDVFAQISIIVIEDDISLKKIVDGKSRMISSYKKFASKATLGEDGCTAYRFISRDTWASGGFIVINKSKFIKGSSLIKKCVYAALDYVNGFPLRGGYFNYIDLPDAAVRKAILAALQTCAREGDAAGSDVERSRDGISALPRLSCATRLLSK